MLIEHKNYFSSSEKTPKCFRALGTKRDSVAEVFTVNTIILVVSDILFLLFCCCCLF